MQCNDSAGDFCESCAFLSACIVFIRFDTRFGCLWSLSRDQWKACHQNLKQTTKTEDCNVCHVCYQYIRASSLVRAQVVVCIASCVPATQTLLSKSCPSSVCYPACLLGLQMRDVGVCILDEAHHTSGNHPYAILMNSFVATTPKFLRPRVIGLTATPVQVRCEMQRNSLCLCAPCMCAQLQGVPCVGMAVSGAQ